METRKQNLELGPLGRGEQCISYMGRGHPTAHLPHFHFPPPAPLADATHLVMFLIGDTTTPNRNGIPNLAKDGDMVRVLK